MMPKNTPTSMFLNFASKFVERRVSLMPTLISFPTIGIIVTTSMAIIVLSVIKYQNKRNGQE
jgi:hypothetical protein